MPATFVVQGSSVPATFVQSKLVPWGRVQWSMVLATFVQLKFVSWGRRQGSSGPGPFVLCCHYEANCTFCQEKSKCLYTVFFVIMNSWFVFSAIYEKWFDFFVICRSVFLVRIGNRSWLGSWSKSWSPRQSPHHHVNHSLANR